MKSKIHEHPKKTYMSVSKKLFILTTVIAASLFTSSAYSQVYVNAHLGFRLPGARVYVGTAPVVYQQPAPVYQEPAPVYQDGYGYAPAPAPVVCEADYPGYAYYDYPAWNGHFRDRFYYAHYRPYFERDHRAYFNGRAFDHARYEHERGGRGYAWGGHYRR